jgi:hypothetical protein
MFGKMLEIEMVDNEIIDLSTKMTDETPWTSPSQQIWFKNAFYYASLTKRAGGHVLMTKIGKTLFYQTYSTKSDIFIGFLNIGTGFRPGISDLRWTYPMYQTYPASSQVLEP